MIRSAAPRVTSGADDLVPVLIVNRGQPCASFLQNNDTSTLLIYAASQPDPTPLVGRGVATSMLTGKAASLAENYPDWTKAVFWVSRSVVGSSQQQQEQQFPIYVGVPSASQVITLNTVTQYLSPSPLTGNSAFQRQYFQFQMQSSDSVGIDGLLTAPGSSPSQAITLGTDDKTTLNAKSATAACSAITFVPLHDVCVSDSGIVELCSASSTRVVAVAPPIPTTTLGTFKVEHAAKEVPGATVALSLLLLFGIPLIVGLGLKTA